MPAKFSITHGTPAGNDLTLALIQNSGSTFRAWIYEFEVGFSATPDDLAGLFSVRRGTGTGGSGTSLTVRRLDPADAARNMLARGGTFSGLTKTANSSMLNFALNQRASFRWIAKPGGEFVVPSAINNWVGVDSVSHGGTPNTNVTIYWRE
jgi:hypothetical protein